MATVTTSTLFLQRLSSFSGTYPSATAGSNGFDEVNAAAGDTISIPLRSGSATTTTGGQMNYGYTPSGNTGTGGTLSGFSAFGVGNNPIFVSCTNITSSGYISIWCAPSNGGSSVGFRARVYVNLVDNTVDDIEVGGWRNNALLNTWYYAVPGGSASNTSSGTDTVSGLSSGVAATLSVALTQGSGTSAQHSVNGDYYGSANRTVYNGDVLRYRVLSSSSYNTIVKYKWTLTAPGNSQDDELRIWTQSAPAITPPVISSVTHNDANSSSVTATVNLSSTGSNGTLQYAQTTSNTVPSSGWQSGNTFSHPRGTTRYYWASQATNTSGAYSSSVSLTVAALGILDLNIGVSNYNSPARYNNSNVLQSDNTTVVLTGNSSTYTHQLTGCGADTLYYASYTSGASQGSTTTYSNLSHIGRTFTTASTRTLYGTSNGSSIAGPTYSTGDRIYIWAVLNPNSVGGSNITNSTTMTYTGSSYIVERPDTVISCSPSTSTVTASDTTTNPTAQVVGDSSGTQYRLYTDNIPKWVSTHNGVTGNDFTISNSQNELPPAGSTYTYYVQARVITGDRDNLWVNTGDSFTITRSNADTTPSAPVLNPTSYSVAATGTYYTAGWTTQGVSSGVQVPWQGVNAQLSTNGSTWSASIQRAQGETAYIRVLSSSQQSTTVTGTVRFAQQTSIDADFSVTTAAAAGGASQGGGSGQYGLAIYNSTGQSVIIDESSRIGNLLNTTTLSFQSGQTGTNSSGRHAFSGVNCQDDNKIAVVYRSDIFSQFQPVCEITRRTAIQQYGVTVKVPFSIPANQSPQSVDLWLLRF